VYGFISLEGAQALDSEEITNLTLSLPALGAFRLFSEYSFARIEAVVGEEKAENKATKLIMKIINFFTRLLFTVKVYL
jgi:hypothetical protein